MSLLAQQVDGAAQPRSTGMIKSIRVQNYKSLVDVEVELGRVNVFVGENGAGKTNLLEAVALACTPRSKLDREALYQRGIRPARPTATFSAFKGMEQKHVCDVTLGLPRSIGKRSFYLEGDTLTSSTTLWEEPYLKNFAIYKPTEAALRGLHVESRRAPMGIHGEALDDVVQALPPADVLDLLGRLDQLSGYPDCFFPEDFRRYSYNPLGGRSKMFLWDSRMPPKNNWLSLEDVDEGTLRTIFLLALFTSTQTPKFFGVDDFDAKLNPKLSGALVQQLVVVAAKQDKQVLLTAANPGTLDGLDLDDDDQRLFVVYRNVDGHTKVHRVGPPKPVGDDRPLRLSEAFMRGFIGGLPKRF